MSKDKHEREEKQKLVDLVRRAIERDNTLREHFQVGDKFRFVRDRLHALLEQLEKHIQTTTAEAKQQKAGVGEDEVIIYVYLFNAQGATLNSWMNMLTPKLFYEYSVNRPAYSDKKAIESLIRSKANKNQHAYITVPIKKKDIHEMEEQKKDAIGNPVVKVREGAFVFDRMIAFTHNEMDYHLSETGVLVKKTE